MFGITEKYNKLKKNPNFIRFKNGTKFGAYFFGIYLAATLTVGCLGLITGSLFLVMPLAILISNPIVWIMIGIVLAMAYKTIAEPLFHLAKDLINERRTPKKEKGEEKVIESQEQNAEKQLTKSTSVDSLVVPDNTINGKLTRSLSLNDLDTISDSTKTLAKGNQERPKTPDRDSGVVTQEGDKDSFVYKTNQGNYECGLSTDDIINIARVMYKDLPGNIKNHVFFPILVFNNKIQHNIKTLLKEYKQEVEKNHNLVLTSILYLSDKKHFATLVIACDANNKFKAYYCDSYFNSPLPSKISDAIQEVLNVEKGDVRSYYTRQQKDAHNCGIFALENAKKITNMLSEGKSFDEIDAELSKYKPTEEQLQEMRIKYANALEEDKKSRASTPADSGIATPDSSPVSDGTEDRSRRSSGISGDSSDSGVNVGDKELHKDWPTLVHQTNRRNYSHLLEQHDVAHIARIQYGYSEASANDVFFSIPGDVNSLNERLKEYKNKVEQENSKKTFTSVINLGGNHWVTLIVAYDPTNKKFGAYYCDSFGTQLPNEINGAIKDNISLANEITEKCVGPLNNEVRDLIQKEKVNPGDVHIKEKKDDVEKTLNCARKDRNKLVNKQINTAYIVGALKETLGVNDHSNIRSSKTKQQSDGCNCGIFALENAHRITQMLSEGKSFDEVDEELSKNIPNKEELMEKRQEFTRALMNDEEWKGDIAEDGILHDTIQQLILERNGGKNESVMTNIASTIQGAAAACVTTCKNVLGLSSNP